MQTWLPIGPSAVLKGQASGGPLVSGRVTGIAPLADGLTVYTCTANGGVWKTTDGGATWISKMAGFQSMMSGLPTSSVVGAAGVDSLACGAIAVAPGAGTGGQDRIYVGTGEGYISGDRYFGVGPLVSDDGGTTWSTEQAVPSLVGSAFWRLAIDPADAQHVFAATYSGLYERLPSGSSFGWNRIAMPPAVAGGIQPDPTSPCYGLALARAAGVTHVYIVLGAPLAVYYWNSTRTVGSPAAWSFAGNGLKPKDPKLAVLAMQPTNPQVVYALVAKVNGYIGGVYRLDASGGASASWVALSGFPPNLFGVEPKQFDPKIDPSGQGNYDIALAVDPTDVNRIYLGGSTVEIRKDVWNSALYRCSVTTGTPNKLAFENIGARVHADIHAIEFVPGDPRTLWVGCDGGVFVTKNALGDQKDPSGKTMLTAFASRNLGLSTLQIERLGMHPTEDGVLFAGVQDNGALRYTGEELWLHSDDGDGGAVLVNAINPRKVLRGYINDTLYSTSNGGQSPTSWRTEIDVLPAHKESVEFYPPIVGLPRPANTDEEANLLAFGSERVWISTDFGQNWKSIPGGTLAADSIDGRDGRDHSAITALAWASATKLYAGTAIGTVARYDQDPTTKKWSRRIINTPPLPKTPPSGAAIATTVPPNPITSIAVADAAGDSIYVTIGGQLQAPYMRRARIWLGIDPGGSGLYTWQTRSGPGDLADPTPASLESRLLDIHHSVVIVDPADLNKPADQKRLYTGADIGVWRSHDSGQHWYPYSVGIPESAVVDLKLHPTKRILWAGTHGRGVYEISADADPKDDPTPYLRYLVRDTHLDVGRGPSVTGAVDPASATGEKVAFGHSPDIRIDTPALDGTYSTLNEDINPAQFLQIIGDEMKAYRPKSGGPVDNRVFVQVHQRGTALPVGAGVQVMLLLAPGKTPPALPASYTTNVQSGAAVTGGDWTTVGTTTVNDVWPLKPRIAHFRLSSASLAGHDDWCLLVLLHAAGVPNNAFTFTDTDVQALCAQTPLAAWSHVAVTETTRKTSPHPLSFLEEILEFLGLGPDEPPADQAAPAGVVDG